MARERRAPFSMLHDPRDVNRDENHDELGGRKNKKESSPTLAFCRIGGPSSHSTIVVVAGHLVPFERRRTPPGEPLPDPGGNSAGQFRRCTRDADDES